MEPNSTWLVVVLFLCSGASLVAVTRLKKVYWQLGPALLAMALATLGGMAIVNDYYGYYQTWSQLDADLSGSYHQFTTAAIGGRTDPQLAGKVVRLDLTGSLSGIARSGFVYLPPQYFQPKYRTTRFPVVELLHGTPSFAGSWLVHLHAATVANQLISSGRMGPMVLVMPQTYSGKDYTECLNSARGDDETYLLSDVRRDIETHFRVTRTPAEWALVGVSSGGYCAANLGLRHPGEFGAVGIMSGYFRPEDGPAAQVLDFDPAAEEANNPLDLARRLSTGSAPLPSFWLSAGTGNREDIAGADAFVRALHGVEQVTLYREPGGEHNFYAFAPAFVRVLPWAWTQIAPPSLRVRFPVAGGVVTRTAPVEPSPSPSPVPRAG